jgi:replicative DNA helicase
MRKKLEEDILGSILHSPEYFFRVKRCLKPEYFENPFYCKIMKTIHQCADEQITIDLVNISHVGKLTVEEQCDITQIEPKRGHLPLLAKALAEEVIKNKFNEFKCKIKEDADIFELIHSLQELDNESTALVSLNTRRDKTDILNDYVIYLLKNESDGIQRISTPFPTLNTMLKTGFERGGYTLLGGTPGSGKTSFMLMLAYHAIQNGIKVAFLEGEMTENEILERLNGISTATDIDAIREGKHFKELSQSFISRLHELPFELISVSERTLSNLIDCVREAVFNGAQMIFIDYLQVFATKGKAEDEYSQIKKVSETLRSLALKNGVHIFVATSLNRNEKDLQKIGLNSFYGSSQLGHDCSVGMVLTGSQNDLQELAKPERGVTLSIIKNRGGARGEICLNYHLASQRFEETTLQPITDNGDNIFEVKSID